MASSSGSPKVCFNSTCKQATEVTRQGWLCRTGDFADLCDRCASAFKDGKFCDTYHLNASGWRCCESCGKQIHCGCIVSFHMFILLDAGGIECLNCAKTEYILTPNPTWPSASRFLTGPAERTRDVSSNNWRYIAGSGPVPWRQAPSLFNSSKDQHEVQLTSYSLGQSTTDDPCERFVNGSWRVNAPEMIGDRVQATGIQYDGKHNLFKDDCYQSFFQTNATLLSSLPETFVAHDQKSEKGKVSRVHVQQFRPPPIVGRQCSNSNGAVPSLENQSHNTKVRGETRARHQRYWPQFTDQELQQVSGGSNAKITPLFEKVLSASDTGKIGRLVLPKKCAEAYLPPISEPEGYPLVIQDLKGREWVLQYRFWPNNNSRMYVLEGVTPCIQSMQLQAGDTVTFSRLEPEGKLIMGFRKASLVSPYHKGNETTNTSVSAHEEISNDSKSRNPDGTWSEVDKFSIPTKRKKGGSKHLKLKGEEMLQLSVTLEQVQGLLRPPHTNPPTIVLINDVEFEVFQEAPTIESPTEFSTDDARSLCSTEVEPTPEHLDHMRPMINHESCNTMKGLYAPVDLADHVGKAITRHPHHKPGCACIVCIQPPNGSNHKSTCTCNVCLAVKNFTPPPPMTQTQSDKQVRNSVQNPTQFLYADIIRYTQMGNTQNTNGNDDHKTGAGQSFENDPNRGNSSFRSQNIDLNIQPEREEEPSVSDSMGIMRLVQESTQRYMKLHKLSINGITDGNHKNHDL
ncbi:hypothetical protein L1987_28444 [Smallanthus sonchifolius]|uniref:Uncharacterized protein n=1 Tax=Smallanthus sonchifolius TaxID=185202 RepID=A0ACB9HX34_9ASTR|nr:hypothetical protein L1987_28444 [Smallanthus sonchifolius]